MKKALLSIILSLLLLPLVVNAKDFCKVVDGDGKKIGSEIACGSEHFYVLNSNNNTIKLLAKYNLNTGVVISKEKIEKNASDTRTDNEYCEELAISKGGTIKHDGFYNEDGYCFIMTPILKEKTIQREDAKSAHWNKDGEYLYPQVGDVYMFQNGDIVTNTMHYEEGISTNTNPIQQDTNFYDFKIDLSYLSNYNPEETIENGNERGITKPLYTYKYLLEKMGYSINDISLLSISELDEIVYKTSNEKLPLKEWGENYDILHNGNHLLQATFGNLKPYISKEYSWLYSTTYWNSTIFDDSNSQHGHTYRNTYFVFTAEQGKLCGAGFAFCAPETALGCGIRPVITIPNELMYLIRTKTDGNGTIEVVENSLGGETIEFKVNAKKGYILESIVIRTDNGEEVKFTEGDITKNPDGTVSINKNKFKMPFENVTIEARWTLKNPETGNIVLTLVLFIIFSMGIGLFIYKRKESRYKV